MKYFFKKIKYAMIVLVATAPQMTFAEGGDPGGDGGGGATISKLDNPLCTNNSSNCINSLEDFIEKIIEIAVLVGAPVVVVAIIWSGFQILTGAISGNESKLKAGKNSFKWSLVGAAVLLGAWVIAEAIGGTVDSLRS